MPAKQYRVHLTREQQEENRRIRMFRFVTDVTLQRLYVDDITLSEARNIVQELRVMAERMFPGKQTVFDLVIEPRMERVIRERFGSSATEPRKYS